MRETKSPPALCWSLLGNVCVWPWQTTSEIWNVWILTITNTPPKAQTVMLFNTKSITTPVFQYGTPWGKILSGPGSWLSVGLFQHLWWENVCKPIIFHIVNLAMGILLILQSNNKNMEATKQWCCSNPWSQQTEQPFSLTRELAVFAQREMEEVSSGTTVTQTASQWKLNKMTGNN